MPGALPRTHDVFAERTAAAAHEEKPGLVHFETETQPGKETHKGALQRSASVKKVVGGWNKAMWCVELVLYLVFFITISAVGSQELGSTRLIFLRRFLEFQLIQSEYQASPPAAFSQVRDVNNFNLYMSGLVGPLVGQSTKLLPLSASGTLVDADAVDCAAGVSVSDDLMISFYSEHPTIKTYEQEALQGFTLRQVRKEGGYVSNYESAHVATEPPAHWPSQFPESLADCGCSNPFAYQSADAVFGYGTYQPFKGQSDTYPGGGFMHTMRGNAFNQTTSTCMEDQLAYMLSHDWVDVDTLAVFLDVCTGLYYGDAATGAYEADGNVAKDQICVRLLFEFGEFGDVTPTYYLHGEDPSVITGPLESVFYAFFSIFLVFELIQLAAAWALHRPKAAAVLHAYFNEHAAPVWKCVDLLILLLLLLGSASVSLQTGKQSTYMELQLSDAFRAIFSFLIFFTVLELIKFLSWFPLLHLPVVALVRARNHLFAFSMFLFTVNAALAALAHYVWGPIFEDFRTFPRSMLTLLKAMLGEFGFERFHGAQYELSGSFAMAIYGFLSIFILLTMFIVIIEHGFEDAETEAKQMSRVKMRRLKSHLRKFRVGATMISASAHSSSARSHEEEIEEEEKASLERAVQEAVDNYLETRKRRAGRSAAKAAVAHLSNFGRSRKGSAAAATAAAATAAIVREAAELPAEEPEPQEPEPQAAAAAGGEEEPETKEEDEEPREEPAAEDQV